VTYKNDEAFDKLTSKNRSFQIPKSKVQNFLERTIKNKEYIPSVGHYEVAKAETFISKGFKRSSYK
jgi:hypothetical protein